MMMLRSTFLLLLSAVCSVPAAAQNPVRIAGTELVPFHYLENGKPAGIFVEIVSRVFEKTGTPFTLEIISGDVVKYVKSGRADAAFSISYSPARETDFYYSDAFKAGKGDFIWSSEYHFFSREADRTKYTAKTYAELKAKNPRIGVISGASYEEAFWKAEFKTVKETDTDVLFRRLESGEIDLLFMDKTQGRATQKRLELKGVTMLPDAFITKVYTLGFAHTPAMIPVATAFFKEYETFKLSGESKKIFFQYLKDAM